MASFVALDVETANSDRSSICQIGVVRVHEGRVVDTWSTLVDPEAGFSPFNIRIHGITPAKVMGQPRLPDLANSLQEYVGDRVVVAHSHFDRGAIGRAYDRYGLCRPTWVWLDTVAVARRTWSLTGGYGLKVVADHCGIQFRHHDACEDARAAAEILLRAIDESGLGLSAWMERTRRRALRGEFRRMS